MKTRIAVSALSALAGILGFAAVASASTITFSPATVSTTAGGTFNVTVSVDPNGVKVYGIQLDAAFPAEIIEATGMTLESGWIAPANPSINNTAGTLTQMAGIGGGFDAKKTLGTIHFKAKKAGTATISVAGSSNVTNAQGANTVSGAQGTSVATVSGGGTTPPAPAPTTQTQTEQQGEVQGAQTTAQAPSPKKAVVTAKLTEGNASEATSVEETVTTGTTSEESLAPAETGGLGNYWWLLLLVLVLAAGGGYAWRRSRNRQAY